MTEDKVFTRCLMADVRMAFPETLAFVHKSYRLLQNDNEKINIFRLDKNHGFGKSDACCKATMKKIDILYLDKMVALET